MVKITNLKKEKNIISFDYYCENNESEKGYVKFDISTGTIVESKFAPMEEKVGHQLYQNVAIGYSRIMIENNQTERIFCWY